MHHKTVLQILDDEARDAEKKLVQRVAVRRRRRRIIVMIWEMGCMCLWNRSLNLRGRGRGNERGNDLLSLGNPFPVVAIDSDGGNDSDQAFFSTLPIDLSALIELLFSFLIHGFYKFWM